MLSEATPDSADSMSKGRNGPCSRETESRPSVYSEGIPRGLERYKWHPILESLECDANEFVLQAVVPESEQENDTQR